MATISLKESKGFIDWKTFFSILIPALIAVSGWFAADSFSRKRDSANRLKEIKYTYLIDAYRKLSNGVLRSPTDVAAVRDIESAISDIQLLGSKEQVDSLFATLQNKLDAGHGMPGVNYGGLIKYFRNALRKEIKLEPIDKDIITHRIYLGKYTEHQADSLYRLILKDMDK
jgi:hypothetical protein